MSVKLRRIGFVSWRFGFWHALNGFNLIVLGSLVLSFDSLLCLFYFLTSMAQKRLADKNNTIALIELNYFNCKYNVSADINVMKRFCQIISAL